MVRGGQLQMFNFYKNRRWFFGLSLLIIIAGIVVSLVSGVQLDIEFKGGSILKYSFDGEVNLAEAEQVIGDAIGQNVTCQITNSIADEATNLVVNVAGEEALAPEGMASLIAALTENYAENNFKFENALIVNPFIGKELLQNGVIAILIASVLIVTYVWIRFRSMSGPSAGVMALVALLHDILIAFFVFVFVQTPVNEALVAVVLTILGFSINDTIVIYDRIRENERLTKGSMPLADLVDLSINQSLTRSINTSLCTFGAILIAYVFSVIYGIDSITDFALPMMIGVISGTYSTIFLAGPLWVMWKTRGGRTGYEH
jgi:preprotein translocase SecF subunit